MSRTERQQQATQQFALAAYAKEKAQEALSKAERELADARGTVVSSGAIRQGEAVTCPILNTDTLVTLKRGMGADFQFTFSTFNYPLEADEG